MSLPTICHYREGPPAADADGKWRKIDLVVKGLEKYSIRAKEGYYPY